MDRSTLVDKLNEILRWKYAGLVQSTQFSFVVRGPFREVSGTLEKLLRLVKAVDAPSFGDHLDTGNFHGDDPYDDLAQPAPYAINVQITRDLSALDPHAVSHSASQSQTIIQRSAPPQDAYPTRTPRRSYAKIGALSSRSSGAATTHQCNFNKYDCD